MNKTITIDNGNTNPHIGLFEESSLIKTVPLKATESLNELLKEYFPEQSVIKAIISDVGDTAKLQTKLEGLTYKIKSNYVSDIKETNSFLKMPLFYSETLGDDRLCQAYLAWKMNPKQSVVVIDCGTFTTIDYINEEGFLGGYIFPGPQTYLNSFQNGSNLPILSIQKPKESESLDDKTVPSDTENAIQGSLSIFHKAILTFINQKLTPDKVILTGGKSSYLLPYFKEAPIEPGILEHRPTFIHEALFQALLDFENQ